jgi:hypothetical protein
MKKVYLLWPAFISSIIIPLTVLAFPGNQYDPYSSQYSFGYPIHFLYVDDTITLRPKDTLLDHIGIGFGGLVIDFFVLMIIINVLIFLYKVIFKRNIIMEKQ